MVGESSQTTTRRGVLATIGGIGVASLAGCPSSPESRDGGDGGATPAETPTERVEQLERYPRIRVGSVEELGDGDIESFEYPLDGTTNFLTSLDGEAWGGVGPGGSIVAFSDICTHMGCSVSGNVKPEQEVAGPCPCHFTTFDLSKNGLVVVGPATTNLPQVRLEVEDGDIYATGVDGLIYGRRHNLRDGQPIEAEEE